jgi:hypothetical protein
MLTYESELSSPLPNHAARPLLMRAINVAAFGPFPLFVWHNIHDGLTIF